MSLKSALASMTLLMTFLSLQVRATDDIFNNSAGGSWNVAGNWSHGVVPPLTDRAFLNGLGTYTVTLNTNYGSPGLSFLILDGGPTASNTTTLSQTGSLFSMVAATEWIGDGGVGTAIYNQTTASNVDAGDLYIAHTNAAGFGQYKLQGGTLTVGGSEYVGFLGTGSFTQSAGSNNSNGPLLSIGNTVPGTGVYNLSGTGIVTNAGATTINKGGILNVGISAAGGAFNANGDVTVDGGQINIASGSFAFASTKNLTVKNGGQYVYTDSSASIPQGATTIQSGGHVTLTNPFVGVNSSIAFGFNASAPTAITVDGVGSTLTVNSGGTFGTYTVALGSVNSATLTVQNGASASLGKLFVGPGSANILSGSSLTTDDLSINGGVNGSVFIDGANSVLTVRGAGGLSIGGASGGTSNLILQNGATYNAGTGGTVINNTGELYIINGATANMTGITVNGAGFISLETGTLKAPNLSSNVLGASPVLTVGQAVIVTGTTTVSSLALAGGSLTTGSIQNNGSFTFADGFLGITGAQGLTIGVGSPLGNSFSVNGSQDLIVSNATTINSGATLTAAAVFQTGSLINNGTFNAIGVNFAVFQTMTNNSIATLNHGLISGLLQNNGTLAFPAGASVSLGAGLLNEGLVTFDNAALLNGSIINDFSGTLTGRGMLGASLVNEGSVTTTGTLAVTILANAGLITLNTGQLFQTTGISSTNSGIIQLSGGALGGAGTILNTPGGLIQGVGAVTAPLNNVGGTIFANNSASMLTISSLAGNTAGGQIKVANGSSLHISSPFTSSGTVTLNGADAILSGGAITNTGTLKGIGAVADVIANSGAIRAENGELDLTASGNTNTTTGQIQAAIGATVMYVQGLSINAGTIALSGGAFDNNNLPLTNTGNIEGSGIFRSGGLINTGVVNMADAPGSFFGPVTNSGIFNITNCTTTFFGPVTITAGAKLKTTSAIARFLGNGGAIVSGLYLSDPSDNYFNSLSVTSTGTVAGGIGDRFFLVNNTVMSNSGTFNNAGALSAAGVINSGAFTQTGTLIETGNFTNSGAAVLGGTQQWAPGTTFLNSAGTATFQTDAGSEVSSTLSLNITGGQVTFGATEHLSGLTMSGTAKLEIGSHTMVISYSGATPAASIRALLASGFNSGNWDGVGIDSSSAHNDSSSHTALGYNDTGSSIIVKYTYYGDSNLDGVVNAADFGRFLDGLATGGTTWSQGDYTYDGKVDLGNDFNLFLLSYLKQGGALGDLAPIIAGDNQLSASQKRQLLSAVPEPTDIAAIVLAATGLATRRRTRSSNEFRPKVIGRIEPQMDPRNGK
jgi:fibronectin-binding autotransporter adhesin